MKLLSKEIRKRIPPLYKQENRGDQAIAYVKFFSSTSSWTWFATEGQPMLDEEGKEVDFRFFGLVYGHEKELGYFTLNQLASVKLAFGLGIERDMYFSPKPLGECKDPCGLL